MRYRTDPYDAKHQALWDNGGFERWYNRALRDQKRHGDMAPPRHVKDYRLAKDLGMIPEYVEGKKYNRRHLEWMADFMIFEHPSWKADGSILTAEMLKDRKKHEIYTNKKAPEPHIISGLYWRTHPQGLPWNSKEERLALTAAGNKGKRPFYRV